jgi:hypothetical protein
MPRKMRSPKRRTAHAADISRALFVWLLYHDWTTSSRLCREDDESLMQLYLAGGNREAPLWRDVEEDAVAEWASRFPGTRPRLWWYHSAPSLREFTGGRYEVIRGAGRCHVTGVAYIDGWHDDPPSVESTAAYLDRLGLWLPGERERVAPEAFAPELFSCDVTVSHGHPPEADEENDDA